MTNYIPFEEKEIVFSSGITYTLLSFGFMFNLTSGYVKFEGRRTERYKPARLKMKG